MRHGTAREYLKGTRRHGKARLPLIKFLASRVGRHWDDVYSEMSQEFDKRTYVGREFFKTLKWYVEVDCWIGATTGDVYDGRDEKVSNFYVHPHTGILEYTEQDCRNYKELKPITRIPVDATHDLERVKGIWYYTTFRENIYYYPSYPSYPVNEDNIPYITIHKAQLSRKELRLHGLRNEAEVT